ncbi:MAG TPA: hypothetical protein DCG49_01210 [Ruminococcus sp.]|nr:hypothetical protein [Ruminococcus sp.]
MKFVCPYCGQKTFTPIQKATCGGMSSAGKRCPECGGRCVNGKTSLIFRTVVMLAVAIMIFYTYFTHTTKEQIFWFGFLPLVIGYVVCFLFDMFCGKLTEAIKRE